MMEFKGIDWLDLPEYPIVEKAENFLTDDHTRDQYYDKKKESTIKKLESQIVSEIIDTITAGKDLDGILAVEHGPILISAIYDFVSAKYALNQLYRKYKFPNADKLELLGSAMCHAIEILATLIVGDGLRAATRRMNIITLRPLLITLENYAALLFQVDTTIMNTSDKVLCSCAAGALSGGIRTILGFTYVIGGNVS